jgi:glycosyltransferase involved in cell wall biosynthesis
MNAFSVVVPVFNEGPALRGALERLHSYLSGLKGRYRCELIVVDDGSTDLTANLVETFRREHPGALRFLRQPRNQGMVAAIRIGAQAARLPNIVVMDADLSYAPETIEPLVEQLYRTGTACIMASPYMAGGRVSNVPFVRLLVSWAANWWLSRCLHGKLATFTGMVRAYDARVLRELLEAEPDGEFNSWAVAEMLRQGHGVREIPAHLAWPKHRRKSAARVSYPKLWARTLEVARTARQLSRITPPPIGGAARAGATAPLGTFGPQ